MLLNKEADRTVWHSPVDYENTLKKSYPCDNRTKRSGLAGVGIDRFYYLLLLLLCYQYRWKTKRFVDVLIH